MREGPTSAADLDVGVLIDRWEPERGGAERALEALVGRLLERGARVRVFAERAASGAPGEFVRVPARGWTRKARARQLAEALPRAAEAAGCGVTLGIRHLRRVDLYWPHDGAHLDSLAARREAAGRALEPRPRGRHALFAALERELVEGGRARRVVCVSELVRAELLARYPTAGERLVTIDNGVDLERFDPRRRAELGPPLRARLGLAPDEPLLVFAGADGRRKGLAVLLEGLATLRERRWTLLAAGVARPATWRRAARRLGLPDARVRLEPALDAAALWAAADVCALPTWRDTCGLVLLEALASGVPVVTTRRAGAAACVVDPRAGRVLERPAPGPLADALAELLARAPDRAAARAAVADRARKPWLERLVRELESLARSGRARAE
jgi:UDP-glucose:(heptosyl)LPS alpha-1,3-glucosyltransferase